MPRTNFWAEIGAGYGITKINLVLIYDIPSDVKIIITQELSPHTARVSNRHGQSKLKIIEEDTGTLHIYDPIYLGPRAAGVVATHGGVAAGHGGVAIRGDVHGNVSVPTRDKLATSKPTETDATHYVEITLSSGILFEIENIGGKIYIKS